MPTGQQPYIYQHQVQFQQVTITELQGQTPFTYNNRSPFTYQGTGRNPIANVSAQQPFPYIANGQQPYPYIANGQEPNIRNAQQQFFYQDQRNARQPIIYQHRSPLTYRNPVNAQNPISGVNAQQPYPYIANGQSPYIADAQQPYPYTANAQNPSIESAQQPYPYIANARDPSTYQHQSPLTYRNPVSGQQPHIVNKQSPFFYTGFYQVAYAYRSPFIAQVQQPSTRPVGPVAKVKGIYRNNNGTVEKVNQVYVNDGGSLEKIHQSVPTAQFQK